MFKLVTFVPPEHLDAVLDRMASEGAGEIGFVSAMRLLSSRNGHLRAATGFTPLSRDGGATRACS
jgi:hypothetical protein